MLQANAISDVLNASHEIEALTTPVCAAVRAGAVGGSSGLAKVAEFVLPLMALAT